MIRKTEVLRAKRRASLIVILTRPLGEICKGALRYVDIETSVY